MSSPDYKLLFQRSEEERRRLEQEGRRLEQENTQLQQKNTQYEQKTSFLEYLQACHELLSVPLAVDSLARSTKGPIKAPEGKYCPTKLVQWEDCAIVQQEIFDSVCNYLHATQAQPARLFLELARIEGLTFVLKTALHSEQALEYYERTAVQEHVSSIISELCKLPAAQQQFRLGDGVVFRNHTNSLEDMKPPLGSERPRPDQFCIHELSGANTLLVSTEYKPPHKLSVGNLRAGLRPMKFWKEVVSVKSIPNDASQRLKYNAEQIVGSVLTQEYHVMICEGLEYSYVTIGLALVLLRVPYDDPGTLMYFLCEPKMEVHNDPNYQTPRTAVARVLCLALMGSLSSVRDNNWRENAKDDLKTWSKIPDDEPQQTPPNSEYTSFESSRSVSDTAYSEWLPSSAEQSPSKKPRTQSQGSCAPSPTSQEATYTESSGSDSNQQASSRKRNLSQAISSSPPDHQSKQCHDRRGGNQDHRQFCTQRCLLGLQQQNSLLDDSCPNITLHRRDPDDKQHQITTAEFLQQLKIQLEKDVDKVCIPYGEIGSYGAPIRVTCGVYGYTLIGKGTTPLYWPEVSREIDVYRILRAAQGSAIPVFLGAVDLVYFLHGAGLLRHMLIMGWGGETLTEMEQTPDLQQHIRRSKKEIYSFGVVHDDIRLPNLLWNVELQRVLFIDFHRSRLSRRLKARQAIRSSKRSSNELRQQSSKRVRAAL
ncbi:unnamed protein product [Penicillium glandicola]